MCVRMMHEEENRVCHHMYMLPDAGALVIWMHQSGHDGAAGYVANVGACL